MVNLLLSMQRSPVRSLGSIPNIIGLNPKYHRCTNDYRDSSVERDVNPGGPLVISDSNYWQIINTFIIMLSFTNIFFFSKSALLIHPRAPNTIHFHLYMSMFLHDLSILPNQNSCHDLIPNLRSD